MQRWFLLLVCTFGLAATRDDAKPDIVQLEDQWVRALQSADPNGMRALLSDDFVGITFLGKQLNRSEWIGLFSSDWSRPFRHFSSADQSIQRYADVNVVRGRMRYSWSTVYYIRIWRRYESVWRLAVSQETPMVFAAKK